MADIRNMFPKKDSNHGHTHPTQDSAGGIGASKNPFARVARASDDASGAEQVLGRDSEAESKPQMGSSTAGSGTGNSGLRNIFGGKNRVDGPAAAKADSAGSGLSSSALAAGVGVPDTSPVGSAGSTIDSLSDLDSLAAAAEPVRESRAELTRFPDETPATAPVRELPDDLDSSSLSFVELIDGVYDIVHDPELL